MASQLVQMWCPNLATETSNVAVTKVYTVSTVAPSDEVGTHSPSARMMRKLGRRCSFMVPGSGIGLFDVRIIWSYSAEGKQTGYAWSEHMKVSSEYLYACVDTYSHTP
jgi:hypothetical protein